MVDLVAATRTSASTAVGASPRGSLALLKLSRCRAALHGPRLRDSGRREGGRCAGALAPADAAAGAVGAANVGRGRRSRAARVGAHAGGAGTGRAASLDRRNDAGLRRRASRPTRSLPRRGCWARSSPAGRSSPCWQRRSLSRWRSGSAATRIPASTSVSQIDPAAGARGRRGRGRDRAQHRRFPSSASSSCSSSRAGSRSSRVRARSPSGSAGRTRARSQLRFRCVRWGNYLLGDIRLRGRDRLGLSSWEQQFRPPARAAGLPARRRRSGSSCCPPRPSRRRATRSRG